MADQTYTGQYSTTASIGATKCNFPAFQKQNPDRPTNQQIDRHKSLYGSCNSNGAALSATFIIFGLLEIETTLPEIEIDLPEIETALPEIEILSYELDINLLKTNISTVTIYFLGRITILR